MFVSASPSTKGVKSFVFSLSGRFNPVTGSVLFPSSALTTTQLSAAQTPMEIREEDFSFHDDAQERPVIQVVTKDVKTADIFTVMQAVGKEEEIATDGETSWWKDAVTEEFTRQDVVVLALIAICVVRFIVFVLRVMWKIVRLSIQRYSVLEEEEGMEKDTCSDMTAVQKQLSIVRFCHLQFLLVVEKLKREMKAGITDDTQQMVAELYLLQHEEGTEATLTEILATLQKIQAKDSSFKAEVVEEHLTDIRQDVNEDKRIELSLPQAWERLHETYASFLRIQATILRRQNRKQSWQLQQVRHEKTFGRRQSRLSSSEGEDLTDEVLQELQVLTKELPQGFTADMFTSLGNAMHKKAIAVEPETSPASSQKIDISLSRAVIAANMPKAATYSTTAQKAA